MRRFARMALCICVVSTLAAPGFAQETTPLDKAVEEGKVELEITGLGGSTGDTIVLKVRRKVPQALRLSLGAGTVFESVSGKVQNMVAARIKGERIKEATYRPGTQIVLTDDAEHQFIVEAYCLDFHKANPGRGDSFTLLPADSSAAKVLVVGKSLGASIAVIQSALWIDRAAVGASDLKRRFRVTDDDIRAARDLVDKVGQGAAEKANESHREQLAPPEAVVVGKRDVHTKLLTLQTDVVLFDCGFAGNFNLTIPVDLISAIRMAEHGATLVLKSVSGQQITGTSHSTLRGTCELGKYSIKLTEVKAVDVSTKRRRTSRSKASENPGFAAICKDFGGNTMRVSNLKCVISWWWSSPYINRSSRKETETVLYLPVEHKQLVVGIPFADIEVVMFSDSPVTKRRDSSHGIWKPQLDIKLRNGATLKGTLADIGQYALRFSGMVEDGGLIERVREIALDHKRSKNAPKQFQYVYVELDSPHVITLKTTQGHELVLSNACSLDLDDGWRWTSCQPGLRVKCGASDTLLEFAKIRCIRRLDGARAQATTSAGTTVDVLLPDDEDLYLGGKFEGFGPARIKVSDVESLDIRSSAKGP